MNKTMASIAGSFVAATVLFFHSYPASAQDADTTDTTTSDPINVGIQQALQSEQDELAREQAEAKIMAEQKRYAEEFILPALRKLDKEVNKRKRPVSAGLIFRGYASVIGEYIISTNVPDHICHGKYVARRDQTLDIIIKKDTGSNDPSDMKVWLPCYSLISGEGSVDGKYNVLKTVAEQAMLYRDNLYIYRENVGFVDLKREQRVKNIHNFLDRHLKSKLNELDHGD